MVKQEVEIRFRDLNTWLKAGIIGGWISLASFILGVIVGMLAPI